MSARAKPSAAAMTRVFRERAPNYIRLLGQACAVLGEQAPAIVAIMKEAARPPEQRAAAVLAALECVARHGALFATAAKAFADACEGDPACQSALLTAGDLANLDALIAAIRDGKIVALARPQHEGEPEGKPCA